jgi:hypothetical protein
VTYTINGKPYTEFDINKRCAELLGIKVSKEQYMHFGDRDENVVITGSGGPELSSAVDYCNNPSDTDAIIDKCWDELLKSMFLKNVHGFEFREAKWNCIMIKHNCTKLIAACICYIELNE